MTSAAVGVVLVEGAHADGATVDHNGFDVVGKDVVGEYGAPAQVIAAILGTRERMREAGYRLASVGVAVDDEADAGVLHRMLAQRRVGDVMLVSPLLAAVALVWATSNVTGYACTGLVFVEPQAATLAVVDSAAASIVELEHRRLSNDDDTAVAELAALTAGAERLESRPEGMFVVGSGVDVARIAPVLASATSLPVNAPRGQELALARGAALASAHASLFAATAPSTAWTQDSSPASRLPLHDSRLLDFRASEVRRRHKPLLVAGSAMAVLFVVGVGSLVIAVAPANPAAGVPPRAQIAGAPPPPPLPPVLRQFALLELLGDHHGG